MVSEERRRGEVMKKIRAARVEMWEISLGAVPRKFTKVGFSEKPIFRTFFLTTMEGSWGAKGGIMALDLGRLLVHFREVATNHTSWLDIKKLASPFLIFGGENGEKINFLLTWHNR
jgi:hypothetical protein